jgi:oligopeptide/dipeptide ABC transporter ATP-binding protein
MRHYMATFKWLWDHFVRTSAGLVVARRGKLGLYLGRIVEIGQRDAVFAAPAHPYTSALLDAVPRIGAGKRVPGTALPGEMPDPMDPPPGCAFHTRCARAVAACRAEIPALRGDAAHMVACHNPLG